MRGNEQYHRIPTSVKNQRFLPASPQGEAYEPAEPSPCPPISLSRQRTVPCLFAAGNKLVFSDENQENVHIFLREGQDPPLQ